MRRTLSLAAVGLVMALGAAPPASAQVACTTSTVPCELTHAVQADAAQFLQLLQGPVSTIITIFSDAYTGGEAQAAGPTLTVRSNTNWTLSAHAQTASWTGPWAKPASDLEYSVDNGTTFTPFTNTPTQFAAGAAVSEALYDVLFNSKWSWENDPPGLYQITVVWTLAGP